MGRKDRIRGKKNLHLLIVLLAFQIYDGLLIECIDEEEKEEELKEKDDEDPKEEEEAEKEEKNAMQEEEDGEKLDED